MASIEEQFGRVRQQVAEQEKPFTPQELSNLFEASVNESHERLPKAHVTVFLGAHLLSSDLEDMQSTFQSCQIYIPELLSHSDSTRERYQRLSDGLIDIETALSEEFGEELEEAKGRPLYSFHKRQLEMIAGSNKAIGFMDLPKDHPLVRPLLAALRGINSEPVPEDITFSDAQALVRARFATFNSLQLEREQFMVAQFPEVFTRLVRARSDLKSSDHIKVLVRIGAGHALLPARFQEWGLDVVTRSQAAPNVFTEMVLARIHGGMVSDRVVSDEHVAIFLFFKMIGKHELRAFNRISLLHMQEGVRALGDVASRFSPQEIQELWERNRTQALTKEDWEEIFVLKGINTYDDAKNT